MASTPEAMKPEKIARNRTLDKQVQLLMKREQLSEDDVAALCEKVRCHSVAGAMAAPIAAPTRTPPATAPRAWARSFRTRSVAVRALQVMVCGHGAGVGAVRVWRACPYVSRVREH